MENFLVEIKAEYEVEFSDPDKAEEYFCDSDWKDSFYTVTGLDEISGMVSYGINNTPASYHGSKIIKFIEGFGEFIKDGDLWLIDDDEFGTITVQEVQELQVDTIW